MNDYYLDGDITPIVEGIATDVGRIYARYGFDRDDASQTALLWLYQHPGKTAQYLDEGQVGLRMLARALRNEATNAGEDAKAAHLGYSRDDLFYYSKAMLRDLLPSFFDGEAWLHPETPDLDTERRRRAAPAEGGNWIATLADVSRAFAQLEQDDKDLLRMFHEDPQWSNKGAAGYFGISEQTMSYRHDRAVGRLVKILGGPRPKAQHDEGCANEECGWWGGRRAMSNSAARARQDNYYEES